MTIGPIKPNMIRFAIPINSSGRFLKAMETPAIDTTNTVNDAYLLATMF